MTDFNSFLQISLFVDILKRKNKVCGVKIDVSPWRAVGRIYLKFVIHGKCGTLIPWQQLQWLRRLGFSTLARESLNLVQCPWPIQHTVGVFGASEKKQLQLLVDPVSTRNQPPERNSYGHRISKIYIFMGFTEEGTMWDLCKSLSHGVLTTLACQRAGSMPHWELKSSVIMEIWHS